MIKSIDFYTNWRTIFNNSAHPFFVHFNNSGLVKGCSQKIDTYEFEINVTIRVQTFRKNQNLKYNFNKNLELELPNAKWTLKLQNYCAKVKRWTSKV
jgi:hypothetical protein